MKPKGKKESEVLRECLTVLSAMGIFHWRQNTGAFKTESGGFFRSSMAGVSDILGILPDGRFLAVECKREINGRLSEKQRLFLSEISKHGGVAIVANNAEEMKSLIQTAIAEKKEVSVI